MIIQAIQSLIPGAELARHADGTIDWLDKRPMPAQADIDAEVARLKFNKPIEEQIRALAAKIENPRRMLEYGEGLRALLTGATPGPDEAAALKLVQDTRAQIIALRAQLK